MNIDRQILRLAVPSIVTNVTVPLLGLCDVTIMGHVGGASHIGAIAVGSMIFNVMYWLFGFLRMGTSGLTAQAYGYYSRCEVRGARYEISTPAAILRRGLRLALGIGLLLLVLQIPLRYLSLWLMQAEGEVRALAIPYYNICIWGAPAMLGLYTLTGWFIGMQNTRIPMMIAIGQNVLNIGASLLFVLVLHMGIEGVALGTVVAQWAGFVAAAYAAYRGKWKDFSSASKSDLIPPSSFLRPFGSKRAELERHSPLSFFRINFDIFLRTVCLVAVNLYFTSAGAAQGALMLAANTLLMQLFMLFSYVMDGFAYAGEALAGRFYGAGDHAMLSSTVARLFRWGLGVAILFTMVYGVGGVPFLHLLTTDAQVVECARRFMPWAILIPAAGMAAFVWDGIFIGLTATRGMLMACMVAAILFFALYFLLFQSMGNHALWLAFLVFLAGRGVVQTIIYRRNF